MEHWIAIMALVLASCAGPQAAIREEASADLQCSADELKVAPLPKVNGYKAEGCGETGHYYAYCNIFNYRPNVVDENVPLVRRPA